MTVLAAFGTWWVWDKPIFGYQPLVDARNWMRIEDVNAGYVSREKFEQLRGHSHALENDVRDARSQLTILREIYDSRVEGLKAQQAAVASHNDPASPQATLDVVGMQHILAKLDSRIDALAVDAAANRTEIDDVGRPHVATPSSINEGDTFAGSMIQQSSQTSEWSVTLAITKRTADSITGTWRGTLGKTVTRLKVSGTIEGRLCHLEFFTSGDDSNPYSRATLAITPSGLSGDWSTADGRLGGTITLTRQ